MASRTFCQSSLFFRANSNSEHMQLEENMGRDEQIISDLQVRLAIMEYVRVCVSLLGPPQIPLIIPLLLVYAASSY